MKGTVWRAGSELYFFNQVPIAQITMDFPNMT